MANQQEKCNLFDGREDEFEWVSNNEAKRRCLCSQERGRQAREILELDMLVKCGKINPSVAPALMAKITSRTAPMSLAAALLALSLTPMHPVAGKTEKPSSIKSTQK